MRGTDEQQEGMFSYISTEKRVPKDHPLRAIRTMVDVIFKEMSLKFENLYSKTGRPLTLCLAKIPYLGELAPGGLQIILAVAMAS
jgi:hypothetical protein